MNPLQHKSIGTPARLLGSALVFGVLLYLILLETGIEGLAAIIRGVDRNGLYCFIALSSLALLVRALRYRELIRAIAGESVVPAYSRFFIITALRNVLVDLFPARIGDLSFVYFATRFRIPVLNAATAFGICFALDIIVLLVVVCLFIAAAPLLAHWGVLGGEALRFDNVYALTLALGTVVLGLLWIVIRHLPTLIDRGARLVDGWSARRESEETASVRVAKKVAAVGLQVAEQIRALQLGHRFLTLLGLSVMLRLIKYSSLYILLVAVVSQWGYSYGDINPLLSTFAFVIAEGVASLPISGFFGFGAYEGAWGMIFSLAHIKIPSVTSVIFAVHLITQMVAYIYGLVGFLMFLLCNKESGA